MIERHYGIQLSSHELTKARAVVWEQSTRLQLRRIAGAPSGRVVLAALRWYLQTGYATLQIWPLPDGVPQDQATTSSHPRTAPIVMHIQYSAAGWPAGIADTVLLHELLHAVRRASGRHEPCAGGPCEFRGAMLPFTNREELLAVLVDNIYRDDPGRRGGRAPLRASHRSMGPMATDLAGSFRFFAAGHQVFHHVERFTIENPVLTRQLAAIKSSFNPLAAFFRDRNRAFRTSLGTDREAADYGRAMFQEIDFQRYLRSEHWSPTPPRS